MIDSRRTVLLTMLVFMLEPIPFGAWLALLPYVKEHLGLDKAQLAIALLGMPLAVIPALNMASRAVVTYGPRRLLMWGFVAQAGAVFLPVMAANQIQLFFALGCLGVCVAFLQVGLNVYAGRFEKETGRVVMSRCHGFWALGLTIGSFLVVMLSGVSPLWALTLANIPATILGIIVAWHLPRLGAEAETTAPPRRPLRAIPRSLWLIAFYALASSMTEGAMSDWAAIYLAERLPEGSERAGIAITIFAGFLAMGRFLGDAAKVRFGVVPLAQGSVVCTIVGLMCLIAPLPLAAAYVGFALAGLGAAVGYPLAVSSVAALDDRYEGANIATLSMVTVIGFLLGPPMIGFLADTFSLKVGLAALVPGLVVAFGLAQALKPHPNADGQSVSALGQNATK